MTTNNKYFKELATRCKVIIPKIERWVFFCDKNLPLPIRIGLNRILWDMQILDWERSRKER